MSLSGLEKRVCKMEAKRGLKDDGRKYPSFICLTSLEPKTKQPLPKYYLAGYSEKFKTLMSFTEPSPTSEDEARRRIAKAEETAPADLINWRREGKIFTLKA